MHFKKLKNNGAVLALFSGVGYGSLGFFGIKLMDSGFSINTMLFWRFLVATLFMAFILKFFSQTKFIKTTKKFLPEIILIFCFGFVFYGLSSAFFFIACKHLGTGLSMVIFYAYPVFVALISWALERIKLDLIAGGSLFLVVLGCILIASSHDFTFHLEGIIYALVGCVAYAIYVYISKRRIKKIDDNLSTLVVSLSNLLLFGVLAYWDNTLSTPTNFIETYYIIAIGIIATALPILLLLKSLNFISATKASILSVSEPIVTLLIGVILLHEAINITQIIGILLIFSGAILIQFEKQT